MVAERVSAMGLVVQPQQLLQQQQPPGTIVQCGQQKTAAEKEDMACVHDERNELEMEGATLSQTKEQEDEAVRSQRAVAARGVENQVIFTKLQDRIVKRHFRRRHPVAAGSELGRVLSVTHYMRRKASGRTDEL